MLRGMGEGREPKSLGLGDINEQLNQFRNSQPLRRKRKLICLNPTVEGFLFLSVLESMSD